MHALYARLAREENKTNDIMRPPQPHPSSSSPPYCSFLLGYGAILDSFHHPGGKTGELEKNANAHIGMVLTKINGEMIKDEDYDDIIDIMIELRDAREK